MISNSTSVSSTHNSLLVCRNPTSDKSSKVVGVALIALGFVAVAFGEPFVAIPLFLLGFIALCGSKAGKFAVRVLRDCCLRPSKSQIQHLNKPHHNGIGHGAIPRTQQLPQPAAPPMTAPVPTPTSQLQQTVESRIPQPPTQPAVSPLPNTCPSTVRAERPESSLDQMQPTKKQQKLGHAALPHGNASGLSPMSTSTNNSQLSLSLESRGISSQQPSSSSISPLMFSSISTSSTSSTERAEAPGSASNRTQTVPAPDKPTVSVLSSNSTPSIQRAPAPGSRRKGL